MNYFYPEIQAIKPFKNQKLTDAGTDTNAMVTAIALPVLSYRQAKYVQDFIANINQAWKITTTNNHKQQTSL